MYDSNHCQITVLIAMRQGKACPFAQLEMERDCSDHLQNNLNTASSLQAGMEGLVRGLMKFKPSKGTRLSTYLVHWIRDAISAAISACGRIIRTPRHHQYAILQVKKARSHLSQRLHRQAALLETMSVSERMSNVSPELDGRGNSGKNFAFCVQEHSQLVLRRIV